MRLAIFTLCSTVVSLVTTSPAHADEPDAPAAFAFMDNTGDGSKFDAEIAVVKLRGTDGKLVLPRALGQYVSPSGLGGYMTSVAGFLTGNSGNANGGLGNFELGGLYRRALTPHFDLGLRVGVVTPSGGNDVTLIGLAAARPTDLVLGARDSTSLRFGISPTVHQGPFSMRVDFGVDEILDSPSNTHPLLHVNVGVGMGTQQWSATAEYQRVFEIEDSEALQNIGVSVRYHGAVSPYLSVSTPLEDELRGDAIAVALGITLTP